MTMPRTARPHLRLLLIPFSGLIASIPFLASCQVATPFKGTGYSDGRVVLPGAGQRVWVGVTNAQLDGAKRGPFDEGTRRVLADLPSREGYIGHSVRTRPLGNEVWTMTVWRDEASLDAFVASPVHRRAMRDGIGAVTVARFARFEWPADQVPPSWEEVKRRLEASSPVSYNVSR